mgnify:CR=1 FL=1
MKVKVIDTDGLSKEVIQKIETPMTFIKWWDENKTMFCELKNLKGNVVRILKTMNTTKKDKQVEIDREKIIQQIQKINCNQKNNITELANLNDKELFKRLKELTK